MSDSQMNDSSFARWFIIMILAMTVFAVILMAISSFAAKDVNNRIDERSSYENTQAVADRIAPVGNFSAETAAPAPAEVVELSAADVYQSCSACHASGVAGAPIVGAAGAAVWAERLASKGIDALYNNAINGIGGMPAKGGNFALSDDNVRAAVDYMLEQSK